MTLPPVHTKLLYGGFVGTPSQILGTCPTGKVWIITDIELELPGSNFLPFMLSGITVFGDEGGAIFGLKGEYAMRNVHYSWRGRQVIGDGHFFSAETQDHTWNIRVCGYELEDT